jgi:hypothetical protein
LEFLCLFVLLEDDFKTDVDLRVACLILDKQVKLINGNEANILIPQNWVTKYNEDLEKGIDQQQIESKPTPEIPSMYFHFFFYVFIIFLFLKKLKLRKLLQRLQQDLGYCLKQV